MLMMQRGNAPFSDNNGDIDYSNNSSSRATITTTSNINCNNNNNNNNEDFFIGDINNNNNNNININAMNISSSQDMMIQQQQQQQRALPGGGGLLLGRGEPSFLPMGGGIGIGMGMGNIAMVPQQQHQQQLLAGDNGSGGSSAGVRDLPGIMMNPITHRLGNFHTPDLYHRSPEIRRAMVSAVVGGGMNNNVVAPSIMMTNTSPMQHSADRVSPGGMLMNRMDQSHMRLFLNKMSVQSVEKEKAADAELDMNLPFPVKLHYILSNPKYKDCIAWLPHGRAWRIVKPKAFEKLVIPKFFRSAKYASFMRQVNGWAFSRITEGPDLNAYYHEMFLRGIPSLCFKMKRPPKVKSAAAAARNASGAGSGTPDFYRISKIAPLPPATPFKPVAQESKSDDDCPRYDIEPLKVDDDDDQNDNNGGEDGSSGSSSSPLIEWPDPEPSDETAAAAAHLPFLDPFEEDSGNTPPTTTMQEADVCESTGPVPSSSGNDNDILLLGGGGGEDDNNSNNNKSEEAIIKELSKADIRYLAHQNQILLKHVENSGKEESISPASCNDLE